MFWGNVKVKSLQRVGLGVEVADEAAKKELAQEGETPLVADHYGLIAEFEIEEGVKATTRGLKIAFLMLLIYNFLCNARKSD